LLPLLTEPASTSLGTDFAIKDQLPASENEEIAVEMQPTGDAANHDQRPRQARRARMAFEVKAAEVKEINFAWRVRWFKDKGVVMVPAG
jgi:hypothetical protein